jgi:uncharacterized protein (DUF433 family)
MDLKLFETGIYSIADVSHLTQINPKTIKGWIDGYSYAVKGGIHIQDALWSPEIPREELKIRLSFNDLLEIRAVSEMRKIGIPLQRIRSAIVSLQSLVGVTYPFSKHIVYTDGRSLFLDVHADDGKAIFIDLPSKQQTAFFNVILPHLKRAYKFDEDLVRQWYPNRKFDRVVVDPKVVFGRPVVSGTRIETRLLAAAYKAEDSIQMVASLYRLSESDVRQAIGFHETLRAA